MKKVTETNVPRRSLYNWTTDHPKARRPKPYKTEGCAPKFGPEETDEEKLHAPVRNILLF